MWDWSWVATDAETLLMTFISGLAIYSGLLIFTRLTGLRSFSKMSSFDFAITVAYGSLVATSVLTKEPTLLTALFVLGVLYAIQFVVSKLRTIYEGFGYAVDNTPRLIMAGENILEEELYHTRLTIDDLRSELRTANVTHVSQVFAVIFETTGEVSVIKNKEKVERWVFEDVQGIDQLDF